jgi:hypothetical protein
MHQEVRGNTFRMGGFRPIFNSYGVPPRAVLKDPRNPLQFLCAFDSGKAQEYISATRIARSDSM